MARAMVTRMGFSSELAWSPMATTRRGLLGMSMGRQQAVFRSTAQKIDAEVRRLVEEGYVDANASSPKSARSSRRWPNPAPNTRRLTGDEIKELLRAIRPTANAGDEPPSSSRGRPSTRPSRA